MLAYDIYWLTLWCPHCRMLGVTKIHLDLTQNKKSLCPHNLEHDICTGGQNLETIITVINNVLRFKRI